MDSDRTVQGLERALYHTAFHLVNMIRFSEELGSERMGTRESIRSRLHGGDMPLVDILLNKKERGTAGMMGNIISLGNLITRPCTEQRPKKPLRKMKRGTYSLSPRGMGIHQLL